MEKLKKGAAGKGGHWSEQKEAASLSLMRLFFVLIKLFPSFILKLIAFPVGFSYFLFTKKARTASRRFLDRVAAEQRRGLKLTPGVEPTPGVKPGVPRLSVLKNFIAFALTLIEKADSWMGRVSFDGVELKDDAALLTGGLEEGRGAALICSHIGNMELLRALADYKRTGLSREVPVTSVADFNTFFNDMIQSLNPRSKLRIINANEIGPETVIFLGEQISAGGLMVIAGDRTSAGLRDRIFSIPFLGAPAPFPQGVFLLAALLEAPVYAVFGLRRRDISLRADYDMHIHRIGGPGSGLSRGGRQKLAESCAARFAALLEQYCLQYPHQWYNFYDFWAGGIV
ncbi:MAG: hypothetical protein LBQ44_02890 [Treponema sp.]|jgi:predicted LPLAT superfamily acyltransferase|nr:hypothetical protein [Treponema sp.]